ncbi:SDR family NAD(P)-dependent oxidoreductase [Flavobacterium flavigenum]|uniref:SDR family NAD(P)-dependent oxidoreductase n=1 Tax=Flavobacterium flavigenum TaxID=3003258 RepID=UPI0024830D01|nr:SDR family oxidoreductase [Flavobacterium flavigenum]
MKEYVLITGASSGIGYEMAVELANKKFNLILVARNENELKKIQAELIQKYAVLVEIIVKDLSVAGAATELYNEINKLNLTVTTLINNAGVGNYGNFIETSLEEELQMIQLNISSLVVLTKLFAKDMVARKSGKIMNVASLLSFLPFPYYSVYSATKTFVLAFTETVAAELEDSGVVITALCPGPIDTGFTTNKMATTNAYKTNKPIHPKVVAIQGIKLLLNGKGKKIVGFTNWFISNLPRITPDFIMMKIKKKLASQQN